MSWKEDPATLAQRAYLVILKVCPPKSLSKGEADTLIKNAKAQQRRALHRRGLM